MSAPSPTTSPEPNITQLAELTLLYDSGRYLEAFDAIKGFAPVDQWRSVPSLILAGRLVSQWGDRALSNRLHQRAYRLAPQDDDAAYYYALNLWHKHGVFETLGFLQMYSGQQPVRPTSRTGAHLQLLQARILGLFRDFSAAEPIIEDVLRRFPDDPWAWVEKSGLLRDQDRYEESYDAACESSRLRPWYRPALIAQAHLLQLLERDAEALTLLQSSLTQTQSAALAQMLVLALEEQGRHREILVVLDRVAELLPMADKAERSWIASRRSDAAYRSGERSLALTSAQAVDTPYYKKMAERLAVADPAGRRVLLGVGFVRQHHMTCSPATLAAISNYWNVPADHLEIARQICYDGSPDHAERCWAEQAGWHVREFRATWETTCALLDRGCPFGLVTVGVESSHMQAVIGYDSNLGTLLIRDPYQRNFSEWLAPEFFKDHSAHGPRALLLIPADRLTVIEGVELPDASLHDHWHIVRCALHAHDRPAAIAAVTSLKTADAGHLLTLRAELELAQYDGRPAQALELAQRIRTLFPDNHSWCLTELRLLQRVGRTAEHRARLQELGGQRRALVTLRREYAEDLLHDARRHHQAQRILRALLRRQAVDAGNLRAYANLLWSQRTFDQAMSIYRLAACLADKVEYHWSSYFSASRHLGRVEESLTLLRQRFARWGRQSYQPARTLFTSLDALDRTSEAFDVLREACLLRPADGELLLFAAESYSRYGRMEEALQALASAESKVARIQWLHGAARLSSSRQDHRAALAHWRELLALNPADTDTHGAIARLLWICEGRPGALAHLAAACEAQPYLLPLQRLRIEWLRKEPPEQSLTAIETLLKQDGSDAWALREKAIVLQRLRRLEEALACADEALRIAPHAPASHGVRADVLLALGRDADAHAGFTAGLRLSIDADWLFERLVAACPDYSARRQAVTFLHGELLRQTSLDNAYLSFRSTARRILSQEELTERLHSLQQAHPEAWSSWSVLIAHHCDAGQWDRALVLAMEATGRFPLLPQLWLDLARIHGARGEDPAEITAMEKALAINPAWSPASRQLSAAYERRHQLDLAHRVLQRAIAADPTDATNHGWFADILWRQQKPTEAIAALEQALALFPGYIWAWSRLTDWCRLTGEPDRAVRLAVKFTETRPGETASWLQLVRLRLGDPDIGENLAALERATQLDPLDTEPWDMRAELLAERFRFEEALACCRPAALGDPPPYILQGRAAWIEYKRGRLDAAIKGLTAVVQQHPDYLWGWSRLTEWHWENNQYDESQAAAEKWAWLATDSAVPHGYLGSIHKKAGRKPEAKAAFSSAIKIDPLYDFGAFELLSLHLKDGEFAEAEPVLKHIATHLAEWESLRAQVYSACARGDRPGVLYALGKLALQPASATGALRRATEHLFEAQWDAEIETTFAPLLANQGCLPEIGELWLRARKKRSLWRSFWLLRRLAPAPLPRARAFGALVSWLGDAKRTWVLRWVCWQWRDLLHADPENWGEAGYAFSTSGCHRQVIRWMRDWNRRPTPPAPWMLHNLVLSLQSCGQPGTAVQVLDYALGLPADHIREKLLLWRACEYALAGETLAARRMFDSVNLEGQTQFYQAIAGFTQRLLEIQTTALDQGPPLLHSVEERLEQQLTDNPDIARDPALRGMYRRTLRWMGRHSGRRWLVVKSRLPVFTGFGSQSSGEAFSPAMGWWMFFALFMILRGCAS